MDIRKGTARRPLLYVHEICLAVPIDVTRKPQVIELELDVGMEGRRDRE